MKLIRYLLLVLVCGLAVPGCGPGAGDPNAPVDNPPSTDASDSAAMPKE